LPPFFCKNPENLKICQLYRKSFVNKHRSKPEIQRNWSHCQITLLSTSMGVETKIARVPKCKTKPNGISRVDAGGRRPLLDLRASFRTTNGYSTISLRFFWFR
jgi:hypothetical protein